MESTAVFCAAKNALLPDPKDERAGAVMAALKPGDKVLIRVHKARNPEHNALAHKVFQKIADAIGQSMDAVKLWLKWETGYVDLVQLPNGKHIASARSLRFESLGQAEFQKWWDEAWPIIAEKVLPNIPQKDFEEIRNIVAPSIVPDHVREREVVR